MDTLIDMMEKLVIAQRDTNIILNQMNSTLIGSKDGSDHLTCPADEKCITILFAIFTIASWITGAIANKEVSQCNQCLVNFKTDDLYSNACNYLKDNEILRKELESICEPLEQASLNVISKRINLIFSFTIAIISWCQVKS